MTMKTTKAEFLRWLTIGKNIRLVNSLIGPCDKKRTVSKVSGMNIQFLTDTGSTSHLTLTPDEHVERTPKGYRIVMTSDNRTCAEYEAIEQ